MALADVIDEHMLQHYRELLDVEDAAFDELEHAFEDGDREHFTADLNVWKQAVERRLAYLCHLGLEPTASELATH